MRGPSEPGGDDRASTCGKTAARERQGGDVRQAPGADTSTVNDLQLNTLAFRWRDALDAAGDGLAQAGRSRQALRFSPGELLAWASELEHERGAAEADLERLARATHTHLHRHLQGPRATGTLLGLGSSVEACVFDLDGVLTASTALHAAAWRETLDEFLARHYAQADGRYGSWRPFDARADYWRYIHGRPRIEGARSFLASRGIRLPPGAPDDRPEVETEWGLAARKNEVLRRHLHQRGVRAYEGSIRFLELAREAQLGLAIVSASANALEILERAGVLGLVDQVVDGNVMREQRLRAKPASDSVLAACRQLGVPPAAAATFDLTAAGIEAGRNAGVGQVIGVDRAGTSRSSVSTADVVVCELADLIAPALV
jgi:HAD superfamily hydrolase (TIGR01509 family)